MGKAGIKISAMLPGLRRKEDCGTEDCFIHTTGDKGKCNKENIVYEGHCLTCEDEGKNSVYVGESSRSGCVGVKQHLEVIKDQLINKYIYFIPGISLYSSLVTCL